MLDRIRYWTRTSLSKRRAKSNNEAIPVTGRGRQ
jgi:hypothetical protein